MMNTLVEAVQSLHSGGDYHCNPDQEDCSFVLDQEIKSYGLSNLGWSGLFKTIVPDITAFIMLLVFYEYNDVTEFVYKKNYWHRYELKKSAKKKLESGHPLLTNSSDLQKLIDSLKWDYGYYDQV